MVTVLWAEVEDGWHSRDRGILHFVHGFCVEVNHAPSQPRGERLSTTGGGKGLFLFGLGHVSQQMLLSTAGSEAASIAGTRHLRKGLE